MNKGVILIASMSRAYYDSAIRCAVSIKDYSPKTNITLFTHPEFIKEKDKKYFDHISYDIPYHRRAKMKGMYMSPYDITAYLDADMEVMSSEFSTIFDHFGDNEIILTNIREHVSKEVFIDKNKTIKMQYHGGFMLYKKNENTMKLLKDWYEEFLIQDKTEWKYSEYFPSMKKWDQFTLWRLLKDSEYKYKIDIMPDDYRWNYIWLYDIKGADGDKSPIIYHHTIPDRIVHAGYIKHKS
jgi:hypothetical protein